MTRISTITAAPTEDHLGTSADLVAEVVELAAQVGGYITMSNEAKVTQQLNQRRDI